MRNRTGKLAIRNREEISFTRERELIASCIEKAFESLDPQKILKSHVNDILAKGSEYRNVYVIGFGKASLAMYSGVRDRTSTIAQYSGVIIPEGSEYDGTYKELEVLRGTHPIVSELSVESTEALLERIGGHNEDDLVIVLISGGGSALFEIPVSTLTVGHLGEISKCMMNSGASIRELNIIRQSISRVKGGKLAGFLYPSKVEALVISDVPGDDLQLIASGPLTKPSHSKKDFERILGRYSELCPKLKEVQSEFPDFPGKDVFSKTSSRIVLKNSDYVKAFAAYLEGVGENAKVITEPLTGDVQDVAKKLAGAAREYFTAYGKPVWIIAGGETTVSVRGDGKGGRNCELSLRVATLMDEGDDFTFASIGTDGIDGVSPAMGGLTDTWFRNGISPVEIESYLERSDSYTLLKQYKSAIMTGYTGTNVSDVFVLYYNGLKESE